MYNARRFGYVMHIPLHIIHRSLSFPVFAF